MKTYKNILADLTDAGILFITLNRPEFYNSLNEDMCSELIDIFNYAKDENTIRVIVLQGNGKGFCAGQDLNALATMGDRKPSDVMHQSYNPLILSMRHLLKPIICSISGVAAGAGCSLVLACDMVIASENTVISEAFIGIGLVPDSGSSYFVPRLTGRLKAFELMALGDKINAHEAEKLGLVNKVVNPEALHSETMNIAMRFATSPLKSVGLIKEMMNKTYHYNLDQMLELEAKFQDIAGTTEDFKEGVNAFKEKRKPNFRGK